MAKLVGGSAHSSGSEGRETRRRRKSPFPPIAAAGRGRTTTSISSPSRPRESESGGGGARARTQTTRRRAHSRRGSGWRAATRSHLVDRTVDVSSPPPFFTLQTHTYHLPFENDDDDVSVIPVTLGSPFPLSLLPVSPSPSAVSTLHSRHLDNARRPRQKKRGKEKS